MDMYNCLKKSKTQLRKLLAGLIVFTGVVMGAQAEDYTWTGAVDSDWSNAGNWKDSSDNVPADPLTFDNTVDTVTIPSGTTNTLIITSDIGSTVLGFTIGSGASIFIKECDADFSSLSSTNFTNSGTIYFYNQDASASYTFSTPEDANLGNFYFWGNTEIVIDGNNCTATAFNMRADAAGHYCSDDFTATLSGSGKLTVSGEIDLTRASDTSGKKGTFIVDTNLKTTDTLWTHSGVIFQINDTKTVEANNYTHSAGADVIAKTIINGFFTVTNTFEMSYSAGSTEVTVGSTGELTAPTIIGSATTYTNPGSSTPFTNSGTINTTTLSIPYAVTNSGTVNITGTTSSLTAASFTGGAIILSDTNATIKGTYSLTSFTATTNMSGKSITLEDATVTAGTMSLSGSSGDGNALSLIGSETTHTLAPTTFTPAYLSIDSKVALDGYTADLSSTTCQPAADPSVEANWYPLLQNGWNLMALNSLDYIWTGAVDTDWNTRGNWNTGFVPATDCKITIPSGVPVIPDTGASDFAGGTLTIAAGASLQLGSKNLVLSGTENGSAATILTNNGKIIFTDSGRIKDSTTAINDAAHGTVEYSGTGSGTITDFSASGDDYYNLTIKGTNCNLSSDILQVKNNFVVDTGATCTFSSDISLKAANYAFNGTISGASDITLLPYNNADFTIPADTGSKLTTTGILYIGDSSATYNLFFANTDTFSSKLYLNNAATLTAAITCSKDITFSKGATINTAPSTTGKVTFKGGNVTGTAASLEINDELVIGDNTSGITIDIPIIAKGDVTFNNANTLTSLTVPELGNTINFAAGKTQTITDLSLKGQDSANLLILTSTGTWSINCSNTPAALEYLFVEKSTNVSGGNFTAISSTDNGGNQGWIFPGQEYTWTGSVSSSWDIAGNWSPASIPGAGAIISIPSGSPELASDVDISHTTTTFGTITIAGTGSLNLNGHTFTANEITNSGELDLDGKDLTVTSITNNGKVLLKGNETITIGTIDNGTGTVEYYDNTVSVTSFNWNSGVFNNLIISKPVNISDAINVAGTTEILAETGSVSLDNSGNVFGGAVTVGTSTTNAGTVTLNGSGSSGAAITLSDDVYATSLSLKSNVQGNNLSIHAPVVADGNIEFTATKVTFDDEVTGTSFTVNGETVINTTTINTSGDQTYNGAVTLKDGETTTITSGANVDFKNTINGSNTFRINAATTFENTVGGSTALTSLTVNGTSNINCDSITTTGNTTFLGDISSTNSSTLTAKGDLIIGSSGETINVSVPVVAEKALTNNANVTFGENVSVAGNLSDNGTWDSADGKNLIFNGTGTQEFTPVVSTTYKSILIDKTGGSFASKTNALNVTTFADSTSNASTIIFATNTTIGNDVELKTSGDLSFAGTTFIGNPSTPSYKNLTHAVGITKTKGTITAANITLHKTELTDATTLVAHGNVDFANIGTSSYANVYGAHDLTITVDSGKSVSFNGDVGKDGKPVPTSLTINGKTNIKCTLIATSGNQIYNGDIDVYSNSTNTYAELKTTGASSEVDFSGEITKAGSGEKLIINTPIFKSTKTSAAATLNLTTIELARNFTFNSAAGGGINIQATNITQTDGSSYTLKNNADLTLDSSEITIAPAFENDNSGSLKASSGTTTFNSNVDLSNGSFDKNGGTVVLTGTTSATPQELSTKTDGSTEFNDLVIKGNVKINNSNKIVNLTAGNGTYSLGGKTLTFTAGTEQTISGTLTLRGTSNTAGNRLTLKSSSDGSSWKIKCENGTNNHDIQFTDIKDSDNTDSSYSLFAFQSNDSGNNTKWSFPDMTYTWVGGTTDWNTASNWDNSLIPTKGSNYIIIPTGCTSYPLLTAALDVKETFNSTDYGIITVESGAVFDISKQNVTAAKITNQGLVKLTGSTGQTITAVMENDGTDSTVEYIDTAGSYPFESFVWDGDSSDTIKQYNKLIIAMTVPAANTDQLSVAGTTTIIAATTDTVSLNNENNVFTGQVILGDSTSPTYTGNVILNSSGTPEIENNAYATNLTTNCGIKLHNITTTENQLYNNTVTLNGNTTLTASGASSTITFEGNITGSGTLTTEGKVTIGSALSATGISVQLPLLVKDDVTFVNNNSFTDFTAGNDSYSLGGKTLTFTAGSEQTFSGKLTLRGDANTVGNRLTLKSSSAGNTWKIKCTGANDHDIKKVDVQDSDNTDSAYSLFAFESNDSGNNTKWSFPDMEYTWTGSSSTDWGTPANWENSLIPSTGSKVIIPASCSHYPLLTAKLEHKDTLGTTDYGTITVESGAEFDLSKQDVETATIKNQGLVKLAGYSGQNIDAVMINDGTDSTVEYIDTVGSYSFTSFVWDGDSTAAGKQYNKLIIATAIPTTNNDVLSVAGTTTIIAATTDTVSLNNAANVFTGQVILGDSTTSPATYTGNVILNSSGTPLLEIANNAYATNLTTNSAVKLQNVTTTGNQLYNNTVTLNGNTTLTASGATSNITFKGNVLGTSSELTLASNTAINNSLTITCDKLTFKGNLTGAADKTLTLNTPELISEPAGAASTAEISLTTLALSQATTTVKTANTTDLDINITTISPAGKLLLLDSSVRDFEFKQASTINTNLQTSAGSKLTAFSGTTSFTGNLTINGDFAHSNGTLKFAGTSQTLSTKADGSTTFYNIDIANTAQNAQVSTTSSFIVSGPSWTNTTASNGFTASASSAITFTNTNVTIGGTNTFYDIIFKTAGQNVTFSTANAFTHTVTIGDTGAATPVTIGAVDIKSSTNLTFNPNLGCDDMIIAAGENTITFSGKAAYGTSFASTGTGDATITNDFTGTGNASFNGDINLTGSNNRIISCGNNATISTSKNFIVNTASATINMNTVPGAGTTPGATIRADNFVLYNGTLNLCGKLETVKDLILLGNYNSTYTTTDWTTGIDGVFAYQQGNFGSFITGPYSGLVNPEAGTEVKVGKNFYANGTKLEGAGVWTLYLPKNSDADQGFAEAIKTSVKNCDVLCHQEPTNTATDLTAAAKVAAYGCTDMANSNTNWNFDDFEITAAWTSRDNSVYVEFNAPVRNLHNELWNIVSKLEYKGTAAGAASDVRQFDGFYSAPDCQDADKILNADVNIGSDGKVKFYIHAPDSWNTDATGTSAGTSTSTDRNGNHKTSQPYLDFPRSLATPGTTNVATSYIITNKWGKRLNNYSQRNNTSGRIPLAAAEPAYGTNTTAGSETYVLDKTGPVLWTVRTGQEIHDAYNAGTGETSQHSYDAHNFLEFRYSEPVDFVTGSPASIQTITENYVVTDEIGAVEENITAAHDVISFAGLAKVGIAANPSPLKLYTATQGTPDKYANALYRTDDYSIRLSIAGYTDGTINDYSGNTYKKWKGYIEAATQFAGQKVTFISPSTKTNAVVQDRSADTNPQIEYLANQTEPTILANASGLIEAPTIDTYSNWDLSEPIFATLRFSADTEWAVQEYCEAVGNTNGSGSSLDRIEFHLFDNTPGFNSEDEAEWFTEIGWCNRGTEASKDNLKDSSYTYCSDIIGGARQFDTNAARRTTGGIRLCTKLNIAQAFKYSDDEEEAPSKPFDSDLSKLFTTSTTTIFTSSSDPRRAVYDPDSLYLGIGLADTTLPVETTFTFAYNDSTGYMTDLAGNRLRSATSKTIDRSSPTFDIVLSPMNNKEIYITFVKQIMTESSKVKLTDNSGNRIPIAPDFMTVLPDCFQIISINSDGSYTRSSNTQIDTSVPASVVQSLTNKNFTTIKLTLTNNVTFEDLKSLYVQVKQNADYPELSKDSITSNINSHVTLIQDIFGNYISMYSAHAISDFAVDLINPLYAYSPDMYYDDDYIMNGLYEAGSWAVHDWNADQANYGTLPAGHPVRVVANSIDGTETNASVPENYKIYLSPNPDTASISTQINKDLKLSLRIWLPALRDSLIPSLALSNNTQFAETGSSVLERESAGTKLNFDVSTDIVNTWSAGSQVSFMFGVQNSDGTPLRIYNIPYYNIGTGLFDLSISTSVPLFCLRLKNSADITSLDLWSFKIKGITSQRGGVTILNNVINPENGEKTVVKVDVASEGKLNVIVMTLDGNIVKYLNRGTAPAGEHYFSWDGKNMNNNTVARGMYFIRVVGNNFDETRKVMVVK